MPIPHDFRAEAKKPIPLNGGGSPLQISGSKLQENFEYLDKKQAGEQLPVGILGDLLYHDGKNWVRLPPPSGSGIAVLSHDGNLPSWIETESCDTYP
jgi:hypothetical protein